ncbi:MAG TPA: 3-deoxy-7-phosphoheptulonate synthase [Dehalococcoidia bacterium]|jgi:3-deoxy-7-phosphoheptulonate synthase
MIVIIRTDAGEEQIRQIVAQAEALGLSHFLSRGAERAVLILSGGDPLAIEQAFATLPGVEQIVPLTRPYRLAGREVHPADTLVQAGGVLIGGPQPVLIAGTAAAQADPAAIELAAALGDAGAAIVRTGVYRPVSAMFGTPQIDASALQRLDGIRRETGLAVACEVLAAEDVPAIARHADLLIVGAEQMHARSLLQACGWSNRPVILCRSESAQMQEWLQAADQLLAGGNRQVVLCEQGIRTYEHATRHTLDLSAVPLIRRVSHLPILVDPGQGSGQYQLVEPLALAAVAAGAHGLLLEVRHPHARTGDGEAAIEIGALKSLAGKLQELVAAL